MNTNEKFKPAVFHNYIEWKDTIFFWNLLMDELFCSKKGEKFATKISLSCYEKNIADIGGLYSKVVLWKNILIAAPLKAEEILMYDLESKKEEYIPLIKYSWDKTAQERGKFWDIICKDEFVYLIGYWSSIILKFNVVTKQIINVVDLYKNRIFQGQNVYFKGTAILDEKLYVPSCLENKVFMIDIDTFEYKETEFSEIKYGFSDVLVDGKNLWLSPRKQDAIVCWNPNNGMKEYFNDYPENFFCNNKLSIGFITKLNDILYFFPLGAMGVLKLDKNKKELEYVSNINERFAHSLIGQKFWCVNSSNSFICALNNYNRSLECYDGDGNRLIECEEYSIIPDEISLQEKFWELQIQKGFMSEEMLELKKFFRIIKDNKRNTVDKGNIGKEIFEFLNSN